MELPLGARRVKNAIAMISKAEHGTYLEFVYLNVGINSVNRVNRLLGDSLVKYKSFIE